MRTPTERLREKLTTDNLWIYILALLRKGELYGYELREKVRKEFGFASGNVTAYRVLYSLESQGFVCKVPKSIEGKPRKYYRITEEGKKELEEGKRMLKSALDAL